MKRLNLNFEKQDNAKPLLNEYLKREYTKTYLEATGRPTENAMHCINPKHDDEHPSMYYFDDSKKCYCFACQTTYDLFDIIGIDYHTNSFIEQREIIMNLYKVDPNKTYETLPSADKQYINTKCTESKVNTNIDNTNLYIDCNRYLPGSSGEAYLKSRGISLETANKHYIGFMESYDYPNESLLIPMNKHTYERRNIDQVSNYRFCKINGSYCFNIKELNKNSDKPVWLVESAIDCMSLEEVGARAVGLSSTSNIGLFYRLVTEQYKDKPLNIIVALDNDKPGQEAATTLCNKDWSNTKATLIPVNAYAEYKDANEYLQADREAFKQKVEAVNDCIQTPHT